MWCGTLVIIALLKIDAVWTTKFKSNPIITCFEVVVMLTTLIQVYLRSEYISHHLKIEIYHCQISTVAISRNETIAKNISLDSLTDLNYIFILTSKNLTMSSNFGTVFEI